MTLQTLKITATAAVAASLLLACGKPDPSTPTREAFETGLRSFLTAGHDQICLGMYDWPIDLTEAEAGARSRHAVQLPVFEKLGLVKSTMVGVPRSAESPDGAIKRYELTDEGRKYYLPHAHTSRDGAAHKNDFCVARIRLGRVENWQLDARDAKRSTAMVSYSYGIDAAPWMKDADAARVLPMVAEVIRGAGGHLQMHQGFTLGPQGWTATPGPV